MIWLMALSVIVAPLQDAIAKLDAKTPVAVALASAEWERMPLALRERAQFSAQVASVKALGGIQTGLADALRLTTNRSEFIAKVRALAESEGIETTDEKGWGTVRDIRSQARLGLIFDQQTQSAYGYARWQGGQDPALLAEFPAQRLVRNEARRVPRDWGERWAAAGAAVGWQGALQDQMVALKNSPIWAKLSRFGTPWPPFDFGSGMGVEDVDVDEAESLGLLGAGTGGAPTGSAGVSPADTGAGASTTKDTTGEGLAGAPPALPPHLRPPAVDFNAELQASVADTDGSLVEHLQKTFGDQVQLHDGKAVWQGNLIGDLAREIQDAGLDNFDAAKYRGRAIHVGVPSPAALAKAAEVKKKSGEGFDLTKTKLVLDPVHLHHMLVEHQANETTPGQRPITALDLELIPHVWRDFDDVERRGNDRRLFLRKHLLGQQWVVAFELNPRQRDWQVNTMYVKTEEENPAGAL